MAHSISLVVVHRTGGLANTLGVI